MDDCGSLAGPNLSTDAWETGSICWSDHGKLIPKPASLITTRATCRTVRTGQRNDSGRQSTGEGEAYPHRQIMDVFDDKCLTAGKLVPSFISGHVRNDWKDEEGGVS